VFLGRRNLLTSN